jgi:hypothetical protein
MLIKFDGIEFNRIDDDEFIATFIDKQGNVLVTMEPMEIDVGETYKLFFGTPAIVMRENLPDVQERDKN